VLLSAVPCALLHARQVVWEWDLEALAEMIELIVSELVTNGVPASAGILGSQYRGRWADGFRQFVRCSARTGGTSWFTSGMAMTGSQHTRTWTRERPVDAGFCWSRR
jgi:hypothetical protein